MWIIYSTAAVFVGIILDFLFGDPNVWWHPICLIGKLISKTEKLLRKIMPDSLRTTGVLLVVTVTVLSTVIPALLLVVAYKINWIVGFLLESFFCWFLLAG